jgi:hypothetical protein
MQGQPWILKFDIQSYFDNVDRSALKGMLQERIADKSLMRNRPTPGVLFSGQLLRRCLAAMSASGVARVRRSVMQDEFALG